MKKRNRRKGLGKDIAGKDVDLDRRVLLEAEEREWDDGLGDLGRGHRERTYLERRKEKRIDQGSRVNGVAVSKKNMRIGR